MNPATYRFTVTGMHCASCGLLIDETVEDLPGVVSAETRGTTTTVRADPAVASSAEIAAAISALGYGCEGAQAQAVGDHEDR